MKAFRHSCRKQGIAATARRLEHEIMQTESSVKAHVVLQMRQKCLKNKASDSGMLGQGMVGKRGRGLGHVGAQSS